MHVFVAMPYHMKDGIDFDKVNDELIKPALMKEGFEVFRADEEMRAGEIRTDMFQELLLADLVIADLSIDNPNVWYELGVRHALRARGVIQIKCKRSYMPFDVYTDRTFTYHLKDGVPDPDFLDSDKKTLAEMCKETVSSWYGRKISPVFRLLPFLEEPDWKKLKVGDVMELWDKYDSWMERINIARKKQRPGDIMVLADEAPIQALRLEAYRAAGKALLQLGQFTLALEQTENALSIDPEDKESRQNKGIILGRLRRYDESKEWLEATAKKYPENSEIYSLLGRVEKDAWIEAWRKCDNNDNNNSKKTSEEMTKDASNEYGLLQEAINPYLTGFLLDPSHYYSGINALTLLYLHKHLTGTDAPQGENLQSLEGGIRWAIKCALNKETINSKDYWARVTLGDLEVLVSDTHIVEIVEKTYQYAVAAAEKDWFALNSSWQQLLILRDLGFRPEQVSAAIKIFEQVLEKLEGPTSPRLVFLFSGHMIDAPGRAEPRFPPDKEAIAAKAIDAKLDELGACKDDLALCGGACGGDLLFAEACLQRDIPLQIRIPFNEPTFLQKSVAFAGNEWRNRFYKVKNNPTTKLYSMPDELGLSPKGVDEYSRNNLWQLYSALAWTPEKVHFICLWNGREGDGRGGTKQMYDEVLKHFGQVNVLDTNELFFKI